MEILPNLKIIDLALWVELEQTLIVGDFHLGYEGELEEKGFLLPKFQLKDILKRLETIFQQVKPKIIIINGDLKHNYAKILKQEWRDVLKLVDFLKRKCQQLIIVRGNHDLFLGPIASKKNIKIVDYYLIKDILICHGDKIVPAPKIKTIILGHEHPAVILKENTKSEKFKCFLKGKFKRKNIIIMPSFNHLTYGSDITKQDRFSPYLKDISNFQIFVVGEKTYDFGKVANLP